MPTSKPRLQAVFDEEVYTQLQKLSEAFGKSLSLLISELVVEALQARAAVKENAFVHDQLRHVLNQLEAQEQST